MFPVCTVKEVCDLHNFGKVDAGFIARIRLSSAEKNNVNIVNMLGIAHLVTGDERFARSCVNCHKHERDISRMNLGTNLLNQQVLTLQFPPAIQLDSPDNGNVQNSKEIDRISDKPTMESPNSGPSHVHQYDGATEYGD